MTNNKRKLQCQTHRPQPEILKARSAQPDIRKLNPKNPRPRVLLVQVVLSVRGIGALGWVCVCMDLPLVSREWKNGSNSSYNCTPFLHSLLTKGKWRETPGLKRHTTTICWRKQDNHEVLVLDRCLKPYRSFGLSTRPHEKAYDLRSCQYWNLFELKATPGLEFVPPAGFYSAPR